ncbi:MAG: hypothetical protein RL543_426, partial [Pseudomonadota bacterium]
MVYRGTLGYPASDPTCRPLENAPGIDASGGPI